MIFLLNTDEDQRKNIVLFLRHFFVNHTKEIGQMFHIFVRLKRGEKIYIFTST
jgi:hypothetical protein